MTAPLYYLRQQGKIRGPFAAEQIDRLLSLGKVPAPTEVSEDRRVWCPIERHPRFAVSAPAPAPIQLLDALPAPPPPIPRPSATPMPTIVSSPDDDFVIHLTPPAATALPNQPPPEPIDASSYFGDIDVSGWKDDV